MTYLPLFVFVCLYWCPTHIMLCFCFIFLRLVHPLLSVSLDCPVLLAPSVFSYVFLKGEFRIGKFKSSLLS
jgi:hypothetical protein